MTRAAATPGPAGRGIANDTSLRLRVIGCEVLARPLYLAAARSRHVVDVSFLRRGLHDVPTTLRERLQEEIDAAAGGEIEYDAVVLAYGLCGGATAGIRATRIPLVVPRAHDCITLFLGSRERYNREVVADPGTYWYSADYVERDDPTQTASGGLLGVGARSDEQLAAAYAGYVEQFGRENADYLMEVLGAWREHYDRAVFIDVGLPDPHDVEGTARAEAARRGWRFERIAGQLELLNRLVDGDWAEDAVVLEPGQRLAMSFDAGVVAAADGPAADGPA